MDDKVLLRAQAVFPPAAEYIGVPLLHDSIDTVFLTVLQGLNKDTTAS
jgi:hypothetical protein